MIQKVFSPKRWRLWAGSRREDVHRLGVLNATKLALAQLLTVLMKDLHLLRPMAGLWTLRTPLLAHPLHFRPFGSDLYVLRQILVEEEHASLRSMRDVAVIVDCGANVGCTAAYFLSRFPGASVIAVEPDPSNFALLKRNMAPYGSRATVIQAAVWSSNKSVLRCVGGFADGLAWATRVEPAPEGEGDIRSVTVDELLALSSVGRIDLLKVDIEGAETAVFSSKSAKWLNQTRNLCIELHGPACNTAFEEALAAFDYLRTAAGELVICRDIRPKNRLSVGAANSAGVTVA